MTNISELFPHFEGTATDKTLREGETAWADGKFLTGVPQTSTLIEYQFPLGITDAAYVPDHEDCVILRPGVTMEVPATFNLASTGYAYTNTNYGQIGRVEGMPAKGSRPRCIEAWGEFADVSPEGNHGMVIEMNRVDGSNFWALYFSWTGSVWDIVIAENNGGSWNSRATANSSSIVDWPCYWRVKFVDDDDSVWAFAEIFEHDTNGDGDAIQADYYSASRSNKTETKFRVMAHNDPGSDTLFRGFRAYDL